MKTLLTIFTLVFTLMFSSTSFADWTKVSESVNGTSLYVDFERIRKHDGYVYWWVLGDYLKPDKYGDFSAKVYKQGDCKLFRFRSLSSSYHTQPMGEGQPSTTGVIKNQQWEYPPPNSVSETLLKSVCSR